MESKMQKFYRHWWSGSGRDAKFADREPPAPPSFDADDPDTDFDQNGGSE